MKRILFCLSISLLVLSACSKYGSVRLNYPLDPLVSINPEIRRIAVVNRTLNNENEKDKKVLEAIVTGEVAGSDLKSSKECLKGAVEGARGFGGFEIIESSVQMYGTGTRIEAKPLDWVIVGHLCDSLEVDALLVLETFDSNTDLVVGTVSNQVVNVLNGGTPQVAVPRNVNMNVVAVWKLYDPIEKKIIDSYKSIVHQTVSVDPGVLVVPNNALMSIAYSAGVEYANRFKPRYYTVRRELFKRGKGDQKHRFKSAFRKTEVANWEGAMEVWEKVAEDGSRKNAGRACLNMAVANEVLGNVDEALIWANRGYEDYNNKDARNYSRVLRKRKALE